MLKVQGGFKTDTTGVFRMLN